MEVEVIMKLFRVTIKAYKSFYVEAENQDDALAHSVVEDEQDPNWRGRFEFEHDSTDADELCESEAEHIRSLRSKQIVKDSEHED